MMKSFLKAVCFAASTAVAAGCTRQEAALPPPNILWITSEDNSPWLGCYGDTFATTPNLDRLAGEGFAYTHAYANAPVCAPSRNTIITGVYAISGGHEHMRSFYNKSDLVKLYPQLLREAGYYCTNNQKEDFNINPEQTKDVWDELGKEAHYRNRPAGKPFFAIFNSTISHESSIHKSIPDSLLRHSPGDVRLPLYHPDTPEMRHDWAQYYDKVEDMDTWVGGILRDLEASGEKDHTIIFYYGDHGGVLGRSKRFVYETGTRVPLIVYIPEKYKHLYPAGTPGSKVGRMVGLVDLAPTLLSILGQKIPDYMQGHAFLGPQKTADPEYAYMFRGRMDERYDMSRAVRDSRFRYIRNYMPYRVYGQYIDYLWRAPSVRSWEAACKAGQCDSIQQKFWNTKPAEELYDTENDPWEVNNLAAEPQYKETLERLRKACRDWGWQIKDAGFIPEAELAERSEKTPAYDYMRSGAVDLEVLTEAADEASSPDPDPSKLTAYMQSEEAAVRYWGATGFLILGEKARPSAGLLRTALNDASPNVVVVAAEALYKLGEKNDAKTALIRVLQNPNPFARAHALNAIDYTEDNSREIQQAVIGMARRIGKFESGYYDMRMAKALLLKWKINVKSLGFPMDW